MSGCAWFVSQCFRVVGLIALFVCFGLLSFGGGGVSDVLGCLKDCCGLLLLWVRVLRCFVPFIVCLGWKFVLVV